MNVDPLKDGLYKVLSEEKSLYQDLLEMARQKKDAVVEGNVPLLDTLVARERKHLAAIKQLESKRMAALVEMAAAGMIPSKDMTMEQLASHLGGDTGLKLHQLKKDFNRVILELQRYNDLNKKLIGTHLEYAAFCTDTFLQAGNVGNNYNNAGQESHRSVESMGILDKEI